jgi:hypothetical protein
LLIAERPAATNRRGRNSTEKSTAVPDRVEAPKHLSYIATDRTRKRSQSTEG